MKRYIITGILITAAILVQVYRDANSNDPISIIEYAFFVPLIFIFLELGKISNSVSAFISEYKGFVPPGVVKIVEDKHLLEMARRQEDAKRRIFLMYLRTTVDPSRASKEYWEKSASTFLKKTEDRTKICRIATIENSEKLLHLLKNNAFIFDNAKGKLGKTDYTLLFHPCPELIVAQVDIIDDDVFLFSPYAADHGWNTVLLTNTTLTQPYIHNLEKIADYLNEKGEHTLLRTFNKRPNPNNDLCYYSENELRTIVKIMKGMRHPEPADYYKEYLARYLPPGWSWENFCKKHDSYPEG